MSNSRTIVTVVLLSLLAAVPFVKADGWKSYSFKYKLNGKERGNSISIPQYEGKKLPIRGVMQGCGGPLREFAYRNQVAMLKGMDQGRGFSKELLAAAAKASGRPEIEFAGAIVQGVSKLGRAAAAWANDNQARAIAVILDHSAAFCAPTTVKGVPMFFNATYANLYQGIDRRVQHFIWCKGSYSQGQAGQGQGTRIIVINKKGENHGRGQTKAIGQACTAIVDINKKGGHHGRGQTTLTAIWLEEAMSHRVPRNIPIGKPYKLIDVDPRKCGGIVTAELAKDGKRSYHTKVSVIAKEPVQRKPIRRAPAHFGFRSKKKPPAPKTRNISGKWWIPGPKSAAMYLEWVKLNGGEVVKDESSRIKTPWKALAKK